MARGVQEDMTIGFSGWLLSLAGSIGAACSGLNARADQRQPNKRSAYPIPTPAAIDPKNTLSRTPFPRRMRQKESRLGPPIFSASLSYQRLIAFAQACSAAQADHSRTAPRDL
jgi:hypothetical protein